MKKILRKFLSTIREHEMVGEGDSVLVCVSGGPDSVCLLHIFARLKRKLGVERLGVAHVNYGTRGDESEEDEKFVTSLSGFLGVPLYVKRVTSREKAHLKRGNFQERARNLRYSFFKEVAAQEGFSKIATAHTRDDQAETVLMRFLTGSGPTGLKGIPPVADGVIIRPLLEISRREIIEFLDQEGLSFRIDSSNEEGVYERNRLRLQAFPLLEKIMGRDVKAAIAKEAHIFRQVDSLLDELAAVAFNKLVDNRGGVWSIDVEGFSELHILVRMRVLQVMTRRATGREASSNLMERADELLTREFPSFKMNFPGGFVLVRSYDEARLERGREADYAGFEHTVEGPGRLDLGEGRGVVRIKVEEIDDVEKVLRDIVMRKEVAAFEYREGFFPLTIRSFRPGDRVVPFGRKSPKKLKNIFIERKVPREVRREIPVVESAGEIIWVPGVVRSYHSPIRDGTRKIIVLEYNRS